MEQTGRQVNVRVIPRPAPRRRSPSRLPLWALLAVFGVLIGAFAVSARVGLPLPALDRSNPLADFSGTQEQQRRDAVSSAPESAVSLTATENKLAPPVVEERAQPAPLTVSEPSSAPLPSSALLFGLRHEYQGWNNCAPSSVGMVLSFFDRTEAQAEIAPILKPDPNDKNVSPAEIEAYARSIGFQAHVGVGGDIHVLKQLLAAGIPVIVEIWFEPRPDDGMGHYRVLFGYDEQNETFNAHDSFVGPSLTMTYDELDAMWHVFNRTYVVIYPQEDQPTVDEILGDNAKGTQMWQQALRIAQEELAQDRNNAFAWFNLGTSALKLGDTFQAAQAFDWARQLGLPWRMFWYQFGPFEAYMAQGRYHDVIALAEAGMEDASIEEWYYWRGRALEMTGNSEGARSDFLSAIALNANYVAAKEALRNSREA